MSLERRIARLEHARDKATSPGARVALAFAFDAYEQAFAQAVEKRGMAVVLEELIYSMSSVH